MDNKNRTQVSNPIDVQRQINSKESLLYKEAVNHFTTLFNAQSVTRISIK